MAKTSGFGWIHNLVRNHFKHVEIERIKPSFAGYRIEKKYYIDVWIYKKGTCGYGFNNDMMHIEAGKLRYNNDGTVTYTREFKFDTSDEELFVEVIYKAIEYIEKEMQKVSRA